LVLEAGRPTFLGATTGDADASYALATTTAAGAATTGTFTAGFLTFAGLPAFLGATYVDETDGLSATTGAATTTGTFFADTGLPAFLWTTTAAGEGDGIAATLVADEATTTAAGLLPDAGGLPAFLGATTAAIIVAFCSLEGVPWFFDGKAETTFLAIPAGLPTFLGAAGAGAALGFDTEAELAEGLPAFLG